MPKMPSITHINQRFRGPSENEKHALLIGQALHDIRELCWYMDRNDRDKNNIIHGQTDYIKNNHIRLITWTHQDDYDVISNIGTKVKLVNKNVTLLPFENIPKEGSKNEITGIKNRIKKIEDKIDNMTSRP